MHHRAKKELREEGVDDFRFSLCKAAETFGVAKEGAILNIGMESMLDQHRAAATALRTVADDAIVIGIGLIGVSSGLDAAVRGLHNLCNTLAKCGRKRRISLFVGERIVNVYASHAMIAFGGSGGAGRIGMQREEQNRSMLTCIFSSFLESGIILYLFSRQIYREAPDPLP